TSSSLSGDAFAAEDDGVCAAVRTLPVVGGSSCEASPCVAAGFDWNRSPSLVEVSQPLNQNRQLTVAASTRTALARIFLCPPTAEHPIAPLEGKAPEATPATGHATLSPDG